MISIYFESAYAAYFASFNWHKLRIVYKIDQDVCDVKVVRVIKVVMQVLNELQFFCDNNF